MQLASSSHSMTLTPSTFRVYSLATFHLDRLGSFSEHLTKETDCCVHWGFERSASQIDFHRKNRNIYCTVSYSIRYRLLAAPHTLVEEDWYVNRVAIKRKKMTIVFFSLSFGFISFDFFFCCDKTTKETSTQPIEAEESHDRPLIQSDCFFLLLPCCQYSSTVYNPIYFYRRYLLLRLSLGFLSYRLFDRWNGLLCQTSRRMAWLLATQTKWFLSQLSHYYVNL